jgi:hypothetical protein
MGAGKNIQVKRFRSSYVDKFHRDLKRINQNAYGKRSKNPSKRVDWYYYFCKFIRETIVNFNYIQNGNIQNGNIQNGNIQNVCHLAFTSKKYISVYNLNSCFEIIYLPWYQYIKYLKNKYSNKSNKIQEKINNTINSVFLKFSKNHPSWNFDVEDKKKPKITIDNNEWKFIW